jgi:hypothetical protein
VPDGGDENVAERTTHRSSDVWAPMY